MINQLRNRKYLRYGLCVLAVFALLFATDALTAYAHANHIRTGDSSFFGGVSEGRRLPLTNEALLAPRTPPRTQRITLAYSEMVFFNGAPVQFNGLMEITTTGRVDMSRPTGDTARTFNVTHRVFPSPGDTSGVAINRTVTFRVTYRIEGTQVILTYEAVNNTWNETININGTVFRLDRTMSHHSVSILEDRQPGVTYYSGRLSARLLYRVDGTGEVVTRDLVGSINGFSGAWSATESLRIDAFVMRDDWALHYQVRPGIATNKVLQFSYNEPFAISFFGNYMEVTQVFAGIRYDILSQPAFMWDQPTSGAVTMHTTNRFEQLRAPDLSHLRGHSAEDDIRRLFSMQIFRSEPRFFQPNQAITRAQFVTGIVRAIQLPLPAPLTPAQQRNYVPTFADVPRTRAEHPYIMAAFNAGIVAGRSNGMFYADFPITREEAFVIIVRSLGLSQLATNPTPVTAFADDAYISSWARRYVSVGHLLGLARPDAEGNFHPRAYISNAEAANILNILIEYMRHDLINDYADQIVNFVR